MRIADLLTAGVLIVLGGLVLYDSLRLGIGWSTDGPRSGFFPFWLAVFLVGACVVIIAQAAQRAAGKSFAERAQLTSVLKVLWPAVAAVAIMEVLGLYVASFLYLAFYMRWVGRHSWPTAAALAVVIPVATFLIFEQWFLVPMPKGPLEAWLGF